MIIEQTIYDGSFLKERFAYKYFRDKVSATGNIVAFLAPMSVKEHLIDQEDSLNDDFIESKYAINFCWEIPNLCPFGAVAFQRYFNTIIATILQDYTTVAYDEMFMDGDDIKVNIYDGPDTITKKASVSITYSKDNVALGHTGINIEAGEKAPSFAFSTELVSPNLTNFVMKVIEAFYEMTRDMHVATSKVIV